MITPNCSTNAEASRGIPAPAEQGRTSDWNGLARVYTTAGQQSARKENVYAVRKREAIVGSALYS